MTVFNLSAGEAPCAPQRPNAPGGGGKTAGQRETEAPVRCPGQHHRTLDSNQDGGTLTPEKITAIEYTKAIKL